MDSLLREELLSEELIKTNDRIIIASQFNNIVTRAEPRERSRSPSASKNLNEVYELVRNVIADIERRENVIGDAKVHFTEEEPDYTKDKNVIISFGLVKREPGQHSQGAPFQGDVVNLKPILRENIEDIENPGYKRAIFGYIHDNEIKFTIWARTNKVANERALWFEQIMQEYSWYFALNGVPRFIFIKRGSDFITDTNGAKMYGRPIHYFVKTETLTTVSEKTIEQIVVQSGTSGTGSLLKT